MEGVQKAWIRRGLILAGAFGVLANFSHAQEKPGAAFIDAQAYTQTLSLADLTRYALEQNPRLAQAALAIDAARGRALQAGLYPNPTVSLNFDELGDRTGPQGVNTLPLISQEIVTGKKLQLSRSAACREVNQASLALTSQRYTLLANVRAAYFDVLILRRRLEILDELLKIAANSVEQTEKLRRGGEVARLDLLQLKVDQQRLQTERDATEKELSPASQRLASIIGASGMPRFGVTGPVDIPLPPYELDAARNWVLANHPDRQSALLGIERARLQLRREQADPIPNVTVSGGYVRQNQNKSDDWTVGVSVPLPTWNRNQGRIATATAELRSAEHEVARIENDLSERVAASFRDFASARQRADRYRNVILPMAREAYQMSLGGYQGGQFEYLRILEAQRAVAQANLEYLRTLGDAWRAASVLSGLTLEDNWPPTTDANAVAPEEPAKQGKPNAK